MDLATVRERFQRIMAKKKLNKKVAFIGLLVVGLISIVVIGLVLSKIKDPKKFLEDARVAVEAKDFKSAGKFYGQAIGNSKDKNFKIDLLMEFSDYYLMTDPGDEAAERDPKSADWVKALQCWKQITILDPDNIEARKMLLDYFYQAAEAGQIKAWDQVAQFSDEIIKVNEDSNTPTDIDTLIARGRSLYELAQNSLVSDLEQNVTQAREFLTKAIEKDPLNLDAYKYLSDNEILQGRLDDNAGKINAKENALKKATEILETGISKVPNDAKGYVNLLNLKFSQVLDDRDEIVKLEPEFKALMKKFPESPLVFKTSANYYQFDLTKLSNAIDAIEKAISLEPDNIENQIVASNVYYRSANIDNKPELMENAIKAAISASEMPEAQDTKGPTEAKHTNNKLIVNSLLAKFYLEEALAISDPAQKSKKEELIAKAEENVHVIEQIIGVGEHRIVVKWRGLLDLAKGNTQKAISELFNAYNQFKDMGTPDPDISYTLAKIYQNTEFVGAQQEFLADALNANIVQQGHPKALLEYVTILVERRNSSNALNLIEKYEEIFGEDKQTIALKIRADINGNLFDNAQELIAKLDQKDPDTTSLKLELTLARIFQIRQLKANQTLQNEIIESQSGQYDAELIKLADQASQLVAELSKSAREKIIFSDILTITNIYLTQDKTEKAVSLTKLYLTINPENSIARVYLKRLNLPDPKNPTKEQIDQITLESINEIKDSKVQALALAQFYTNNNNQAKAIEVLRPYKNENDITADICKLLFDIALSSEDLELAQELADIAAIKDLDSCNGNYFLARVALAKDEYTTAIDRLNQSLKFQPVYPPANILLSVAQDKQGNLDLAIKEAQNAVRFDPFNSAAARQLASVLYKRNSQLGKNITQAQEMETQNALLRAMSLEPGNINLQSIYAEYIFDKDPKKALAMRQALQKNMPSIENAILLGNMAIRIAKNTTSPETVEAMLKIAEGSYQEALAIDPQDENALNAYSEYLRITGQDAKIEDLLAGKEDVLWKAYLRGSQYDKALEVLNKLYSQDPKNIDVIKGLMLTAQRTADRKNLEKYSEELLKLDNSLDNQLAQIQAYLDLGILDKAQSKLYALIDNNPGESRVLLLEASLFTRQGQFDKALQSINMIVEKDKANPLAWRLRAQINSLKGNYDLAIEDFTKAKSYSDDPMIRIELAKAYGRAKRFDQAITELTVAMDEKGAPQLTPILLEQMYIDNNNNAQLEKFYEKMIRRFPENLYWKNRLADLKLKLGQEQAALSKYKENLQASLKQNKNGDAQTLNSYLAALQQTGNYNDVISLAAQHIDGPYAIDIYNAMGKAKASLNDSKSAASYFGKALEKSGINRQAINITLNNFEDSLNNAAVESWINAQLAANPTSLNANTVAFVYHLEKGNYNKALNYIEKCIEASPNQSVTNLFKMNKADILQLQYYKLPDAKYLDQAVATYKELLEIDNNNVSILNNLAYLLASSGKDLNEAMNYAKLAYALMPANGMILDTYAFVLLKKDQTQQALELLLQAIQLFEVNAVSAPSEVYEHLGMANEKLDKNKEALAAYKTALEIGKETLSKEDIEKLNQAIERVSK